MSSKQQQEEKEESSTTTIKLNVGGKLYEVSKSLLVGFPDTMLAEKASSSSSSSPIFIDRDPDRFAFCLDYMRDNGKVFLPETVSKLAFLEELKFFGFVNVDETKIYDEKSKQNCMVRFHQITKAAKLRIRQMELEVERTKKEIECEQVALRCLEASVKNTNPEVTVNVEQVEGLCNVWNNRYFDECCEKLGLRFVRNSLSIVYLTSTTDTT